MNSLMNKIANWHELTFDSTEEAQWLKLKEEETEAEECNNDIDWIKEMADVCFIYSALIYRYNSDKAKSMFYAMWNPLSHWQKEDIENELAIKFKINKNRKWEKQPDGTYHHI